MSAVSKRTSVLAVTAAIAFGCGGSAGGADEPVDLAIGNGFVWLSSSQSAHPGEQAIRVIERLDLRNLQRTASPLRVPSTRKSSIAPTRVWSSAGKPGVVTGFGSVWVANDRRGAVRRISQTSRRVTATIPYAEPHASLGPVDLTIGAGRVWLLDPAFRGRLVSFSPTGRFPTIVRVRAGQRRVTQIAGDEMRLFVALPGKPRPQVCRMDPETGALGPCGPKGGAATLVRRERLSIELPTGWHVHTRPLTSVTDPVQRLSITSFPLRQTRPDTGCFPATALKALPANGVLIQIWEYPDAPVMSFPPRPRNVRFPYMMTGRECGGERTTSTLFRDHGRAFQVDVTVGPRAGTAEGRRAGRVVDTLRVR